LVLITVQHVSGVNMPFAVSSNKYKCCYKIPLVRGQSNLRAKTLVQDDLSCYVERKELYKVTN